MTLSRTNPSYQPFIAMDSASHLAEGFVEGRRVASFSSLRALRAVSPPEGICAGVVMNESSRKFDTSTVRQGSSEWRLTRRLPPGKGVPSSGDERSRGGQEGDARLG